tara:strand:- start:91967 stop:92476 length:510 start_codon:yes stop_codon:yes gene_type:complete
MYRKVIATIAAASIALTALGSVPAYAGDKDVARALAAILGVAVVGKIIHDKKKDREREEAAARERHIPVYEAPRRHRPYVDPRPAPRRVDPKPLPRRVDRKLLPANCFRSFDTRRGKVQMFGQRCLENNYRYADRLPSFCAQRIQTNRGLRHGYDARCLRDAGYRLARG